ncbi:ERBB receptor feedback inhibitor 1 [Megalops cyprinoides]|uniref:ERBB receptor feedback inhibitor 1 n=1 Tax=Megalops cyprinoides TaxID=118141 RepID=UPI0018646164|nr:ERBB receptor feedback inhibitor 1 [Megalops cyprinoides]
MRPKGSWIMSTAGLSAQEFPASLKSAFLHGSHCLSMASAKPYWDQHHDLNNLYFSLDSSAMEYNLRVQHQVPASMGFERHVSHPHSPHSPGAQRLPPKKSRPAQLNLSSCTEPSMPSSPEGDQVVPSFQRLSVYERTPPQTPSRGTKPLPPLPSPADLSSDEAVDNEVEFFTSADESRCLVPEPCPKPLAFRYGAPSRRSFRGCGQINYAYFDSPSAQEQRTPECEQQQRREPSVKDCPRQQERPQRRLRRSHSGPAGSFNKPTALRLSCHHHNSHGQDKPEVPPRVPIPPRPLKAADHRRWSAEVPSGGYSDDDKPPKVPPREPLSSGSSRTPSPKSLPSYLNGVMPPTQSFAPNPKYVSKALQRQNSEGSTSARTPCILPIIENGKKVSTTHYFLLPQRPVYLDKFERFFREADCEAAGDCASASSTDWDCQTKHKPHVHMV